MKKRITQDDYIKVNRKASREAEIERHGHPICYKRVHLFTFLNRFIYW